MQFFRDSRVPSPLPPAPAVFPRPKRIVNPNLLWVPPVPRPSVPSLSPSYPPIPTCVPLLCPLQSRSLFAPQRRN